jgi:8-oxo-dGTP pyrophosphatase MutT (NUDIX family)
MPGIAPSEPCGSSPLSGARPVAKRGPRRQYAALPLAVGADGLRVVLLVTSRETRRWIIPKGWAEKGVAPHEQAAREAFEEAGLKGQIATKPIGSYRYFKRLQNGQTVTCRVDVFPLTVGERLDDWPEKGQREAVWFTPAEAAMLVDEKGLAALLRELATAEP